MKSKHLLLLMLLAVFAPWAANAQTVTIGTGTNTYASSPIDNFYDCSFTEILYTAADIAAGNPTQNTIISMGFESDNGSNGKSYGITVYMKNVDETAFGSTFIAISNDDVVYTGTVTPTAGWVTFALDNAFSYDNTKNLLVAVNKTSGGYGGSAYKWKHTSTSGVNTVILAHRDGSAYTPTTTLPSMSSAGTYWKQTERPNVQLTFGAPATCPKPTLLDVAVADIETEAATIRWTASNEDQLYFDIYWSTTNTAPTETTTPLAANQQGDSYRITDLSAATQYYVWIRGNCGTPQDPDISGGWTTVKSFMTACGAIAPGYTCGFEGPNTGGTTSYPLPACWTRTGTSSYYPYAYNSGSHLGSYCLYFSGTSSTDASAMLPEIEGGVNGKRLSFYLKVSNLAVSISVGYMNGEDAFVEVEPVAPITTYSYQLMEVDFADIEGNPTNIVLKFKSTYYNTAYAYIDDLELKETPTCLRPTMNTTATDIAATTATVSWTAGGENQDHWDLYYSNTNTAPTATSVPQVTFTANNPHTLTGLQPSTSYYVWVRGNCGTQDEPDYSEWSANRCYFTTTAYCANMQVQSSTINFTNITYNSVTVNWTGAGDATQWKVQLSTTSNFVEIAKEETASETSKTINGLLSNQTYYVRIAPYCEEAEDYTPWSSSKSFTTPESCPAPVLAAATNPTAHGATFTWTGTSESYTLMSGEVSIETLISADFEDNAIPSDFTNSTTYAWTVTNANKHAGTYSIKSGGAGTAYATSDLTLTLNLNNPATISFWYLASSEGDYDYGRFLVDGTQKFQTSGTSNSWSQYTAELAAGEHTLIWRYYKDSGTDSGDDCFYVDDITITVSSVGEWQTVETGITENSVVVNNDNIFAPETTYQVKVVGICPATEEQSSSNIINFTTANSCETPSDLVESEVTATTAKITWNTYGLTDFNLRYSTNDENWTVKNNVSCPYTIEGLTGNTAYQVQVQATCNTQEWSTVLNFTTACDVYEVNLNHKFNENFDSSTFPNCWDNPTEYISSSNRAWSRNTSQNHTTGGSGSAYSGYYGPIYMIMQDLAIANDRTGVKLTFWSYNTWASDYNKNSVVLIEGNTETELWSPTSVSSSWEETTIDLSEYKGQTIRLAFKYEGDNDHGWYVDDVEVAFDPTCAPVGELTYSGLASTSLKLSWPLVDDTQEEWQVCVNGDESNLRTATSHENYLLDGLIPETNYTVKVRANCGAEDGVGEWSNEINFTTMASCSLDNITVSNVGHYTATVSWEGESADGFTVKYRTAAGLGDSMLNEDFTGLTAGIPTGWDNSEGTTNTESHKWNYYNSGHNAAPCLRFDSYYNTSNNTNFLRTPAMNFPAGKTMQLVFWWKNPTGGDFSVYISTDGGTTQTALKEGLTSQTSWKEESITLTNYVGASNVTIHFKGTSNWGSGDAYIYLDEVVIGELVPTGAEQTVPANESPANLENLTPGTKYEVSIVPNCDETLASEWQSFITVSSNEKYFVTEGNWGTASNWEPEGAPTISQNVTLRANATIESTCVAEANNITFEGTPTPTLTIEDGGQLIHNNEGVHAIVKKNIAGYNTSTTNGGWYFISSPIMSSSSYDFGITPSAAGLITDNFGNNIPDGETATYDLYRFVESPGNDLEWKNYRNNSFNLDRTVGYLYANVNDVALSFDGVIRRSDQDVTAGLDNTSGASFAGWNLMGNPFTCKAYSSLPYYVIDGSGTRLNMTAVLATEPIDVCTGVMVNGSGSMTFSRNPQESANNGNVQMTLSQQVVNRDGTSTGLTTIDNAIVSFNENDLLEKFVFNSSLSKLYIQQDGKDYAIVASEGQGTLPVNFKATENGTYTLNFNVEGVEMSYLHLVDNMTGNDVDLLQTPSYTFDALTTDYESRFKLVFATGNAADDSFAFYSNGNWIINNDGQATLQVIDVTGRILSSESVNGSVSTTINAAPGVYMLRLVNGDNVKVQKVVVR